jgi:hypothetical protein
VVQINLNYILYAEIVFGFILIVSILVYKIKQISKKRKIDKILTLSEKQQAKEQEYNAIAEIDSLLQAGMNFADKKDGKSAASVYNHIKLIYSGLSDESKHRIHSQIVDFHTKVAALHSGSTKKKSKKAELPRM